ncbi:hypothetical protein TCAL_15830 [Tigriopus californicus]|uniref:Uncharacterized protein n=1 Tax=Tigriopus californicus TaxID=6832 RepID=A0A553NNY1_TIGCA|nr:hypothetical protein TCAL_15830 [Tigriopus californicus]
MLFNMRNACTLSVVILTLCVTFSYGGSLSKRDVGEDIQDHFFKRKLCVQDANCSVLEYCDHSYLQFQCKMYGWAIAVIVIVVLVILLAIIGCCCRCLSCCCCYNKCRKHDGSSE